MGPLTIIMMAAAVGMAARIAQKAGFSGWWGFTQIIPFGGIVMMWVLAFIEWPGPRLPGGRERDERISGPD